jgi:predicted dehydrogenase
MLGKKNISRRQFLKKAAGVTAGAVAFPYIVPSSALGRAGGMAPSNRIVMGVIGTGLQGTSNIRGFLGIDEVQVVAVCDVDKAYRDQAKQIADQAYGNNDCAAYNDFREITRRGDIDAVVISTPDHWHVLPAIDAAEHGQDLYVEKPLTLTIKEGRVLSDVVRRYGRVLQTGSQQRSDRNFRFVCELVRNGRLGRLQTVRVSIPGNNRTTGPTWTPQPVPEGFDYDFWLGPAPWQPYHEQRCHYQFRFILDYSGGQVTNWGAHYLDIAQWGLGMDDSGPVEITGHGEFPTSGLFTTATKVDFRCTYADGVELTCMTGGQGVRFEGTDGWVFVNREIIEAGPASLVQERIGPDEIHLYESRDHKQNFLDCIRTRRKPVAAVEIGHRSATLCHLGNIAMLRDCTLKWDPEREEFTGDDAANRMRNRAMRLPWTL